ncbi:unnamed protein product, partial [Sphacelaria rigidula]
MHRRVAVSSASGIQYCVTLYRPEAEYGAMTEGAEECMFSRTGFSFPRPRVVLGRAAGYYLVFHEHNQRAKAVAETPLSSSYSQHIEVIWHFLQDFLETETINI